MSYAVAIQAPAILTNIVGTYLALHDSLLRRAVLWFKGRVDAWLLRDGTCTCLSWRARRCYGLSIGLQVCATAMRTLPETKCDVVNR